MGFPLGNLLNLAKQAKPLSATRGLLEQAVQDELAQIPLNTQGIAAINASIGAANGIAPLDAASKIPVNFLPAIAIGDTHTVADQAEMLALNATAPGGVQKGDVAVVVGEGNYRLQGEDSTVAESWIKLVDNEGVESIMIDGVAQTGQVNLAKIAATGQSVDAAFTGAGFTSTNAQDAILEVSAAVVSEATARGTADVALQSAIDDEVTARGNADNALQAAIDNEVTARGDADTALQTAIDNEVTARGDADTALQTAIANEATARGDADTALQTAVDARIRLADNKISQPLPGVIDGTNKVFAMPEAFVAGSQRIWMNNAALHPDAYSLSGLEVTFIGSPDPGDEMRVDYIKAAA